MIREKHYRCSRCRDIGLVTVVHPELVRDIRQHGNEFAVDGRALAAAAKCDCDRGRTMGQAIPPYHAGMILLPDLFGSIENKQRQLIDAYYDHTAPQDFNAQFT